MWIAVVIFCTLLEGIFTALEVAMNAASRTRLRSLSGEEADASPPSNHQIEYSNAPASTPASKARRKINRAAQVLILLESPKRLALMFLTVTSLTMWTAAASLVWFATLENWDLPLLVLSLVLILFCAEVLPLLIAARHPEQVAMRGVRWIGGALRVLEPLIMLLKGMGNLGARGLGAPQNASSGVTPSELRTALATAEEEGVIESDERALLEGAMDFREKQTREVMTPVREIVSVRDNSSLLDALQIAMRESHSRLPVEDENGLIIGLVAAKDLIPYADEIFAVQSDAMENDAAQSETESQSRCVRDIMRAPLWVEESQPIAAVLEELRRRRSLMAIVAGADGATAGIVTLEDLLEEIVGEIQDEYDDEEPLLLREDDENNADGESSTRLAACSVLCEADVKVRELQRFWRESWGETVRLQVAGEPAPSSLALRDFALKLFADNAFNAAPSAAPSATPSATPSAASNANERSPENAVAQTSLPVCGASVVAGLVLSNANFGAEDSEEAAEPSLLELEIVEMDGERIEKVRLRKVVEHIKPN